MLRSKLFMFLAVIVAVSASRPVVAQLSIQQPVVQSIGGHFGVSVPDRGGVLLGGFSRAGSSRSSFGLPFTPGSSVGRFSEHSSLSAHVRIHDLRAMDRMVLDMADSASASGESPSRLSSGRSRLAWTASEPRRVGIVADGPLSGVRQRAHRLGQRRGTGSSRPDPRRADPHRPNPRHSVTASGPHAAQRPGARSGTVTKHFSAESARATDRDATRAAVRRNGNAASSSRSRALDPVRAYRLGQDAEESGRQRLAILHYEVAARYGSTRARHRLAELNALPAYSE